MAYEIYIKRFDKSLQKALKIKAKEWEECADELDLKIQKGFWTSERDGKVKVLADAMLVFSQDEFEWVPLLICHKRGYGSTVSLAHLSILREIGDLLDAFIYGDDGEVYFIPSYGDVSRDVSIWDLQEGMRDFDGDLNALYFKYRKTAA